MSDGTDSRRGDRAEGRPWWASGEGDPTPPRGDHRHHADAAPEVCAVCPVCSLLRLVGETRPEIIEHLTEAARHLTLAAKAVVDAQAEHLSRREDRFERIDLEDE